MDLIWSWNIVFSLTHQTVLRGWQIMLNMSVSYILYTHLNSIVGFLEFKKYGEGSFKWCTFVLYQLSILYDCACWAGANKAFVWPYLWLAYYDECKNMTFLNIPPQAVSGLLQVNMRGFLNKRGKILWRIIVALWRWYSGPFGYKGIREFWEQWTGETLEDDWGRIKYKLTLWSSCVIDFLRHILYLI